MEGLALRRGGRRGGDAFNVVSRLSDIRDILTGLEVIYDGVEPAIARIDGEQAAQTGRELADLRAFIASSTRANRRESASRRSRRTRSAPKRRIGRRPSPGKSRKRRRSSVSKSSNSSRPHAARVATLVVFLAALVFPAPTQAASDPPWKLAADLRTHLAEAERALILGQRPAARSHVRQALPRAYQLAELLREDEIDAAFREVEAAAERGDHVRLAAARARLQTAVLGAAYRTVLRSLERGQSPRRSAGCSCASSGPRPASRAPGPTRRSPSPRSPTGAGRASRRLPAVRADYLDTYQARLRGALEAADEARDVASLPASRPRARSPAATSPCSSIASGGSTALGGRTGERRLRPARGGGAHLGRAVYVRPREAVERALDGFRAAPLSREEEIRRAGQFLRFLALVPVEYGRGVADGRVTLAFEIQEAITFRDGAAQAFADLEGGARETRRRRHAPR